jgi:hypothetical protein
VTTRFPICRLHCQQLVDELPRRCPLRTVNPLVAIHQTRERGWVSIGSDSLSSGAMGIAEGLNDLERSDVCYRCFCALASHPHVRRLRASALAAEPRDGQPVEWTADTQLPEPPARRNDRAVTVPDRVHRNLRRKARRGHKAAV